MDALTFPILPISSQMGQRGFSHSSHTPFKGVGNGNGEHLGTERGLAMAQVTSDRKDRMRPNRSDSVPAWKDRKDRAPFRGPVIRSGPPIGPSRAAGASRPGGASEVCRPASSGNRPVPHAQKKPEKTIFKMKATT